MTSGADGYALGLTGCESRSPPALRPTLRQRGIRRPAVPRPRDASEGEQAALSAEELDRFADELRELLDDSVSSAERQLFDLRTAAADNP